MSKMDPLNTLTIGTPTIFHNIFTPTVRPNKTIPTPHLSKRKVKLEEEGLSTDQPSLQQLLDAMKVLGRKRLKGKQKRPKSNTLERLGEIDEPH
ncbi:hypothetical protein Fmac_003066 [Flemingia macrophylla]|uniref:Uncharacterized protein n=1 Tax=Flemingia macrophylla TaxID=520843 RepID=A0ABD1NME4_9FABA